MKQESRHFSDERFKTADSNQYILWECGKRPKIDVKTKKLTGEMIDYEEQVGYYATISGLIKGLINHAGREKAASDEFKSLKELIDYLSDLEEKIIDVTISCEKPTPLGVGWIALYLKNNSK